MPVFFGVLPGEVVLIVVGGLVLLLYILIYEWRKK